MEKLAAQLAQKAARERDKREKKEKKEKKGLKDLAKAHGYSNESNPFGDQKLTDAFQWSKKADDEKQRGVFDTVHYSKKGQEEKRRQMDQEIQKVKRRREQREEEQQLWEDEKQRMLADADGLTLEEWEERGNAFQLDQLLLRANNRLKEKRSQPIDVLLLTFRILEGIETPDKLQGDVREPCRLIEGLSIADLKELATEIESVMEHDTRFKRHWTSALTMVKHELAAQLSAERGMQGVHANVQYDVAKQFERKSLKELEEAGEQIEQQLRNPGPGVDVEFWDTLAKHLTVWKARAYLKDQYRGKMDVLLGKKERKPSEGDEGGDAAEKHPTLCTEDSEGEEGCVSRRYHSTGLSPPLTPLSSLTPHEVDALIGETDDHRSMIARRFVRQTRLKSDAQEQEQLMQGMGDKLGDEEDLFDDRVDLNQSYSWHSKYRPRRPKYYNRVHTGFDWHKYNSTHYDVDNPPPKIVMGYKFNIFYPDLVDPSQQPHYFVEPTERGWRDDVCVLRFSAGPPYEDIAFKIVNKEWDKNWRGGFKCTFDRGVFHLHFSFVKYRYRR